MFKVESYLTPILLSYVDKYIKDFRPEDSQVSLWGGDACFHNLDLRLEVLEEELQLPFSFVSGHIHELLFHVPWTKINSEPITITINTIECVLKLRSEDQTSDDGGRSANTSEEKKRKLSIKSNRGSKNLKSSKSEDLPIAPPGYIQSLVTKIVNNITIFCNNLILKYVEEDIVLSVNIKTVKVQSADEKWDPAFAELSPIHTLLRKLITLSDLTICLDKRNSSGKIEMYQEPLLYRCVMQLRLLRSYHNSKSKQASVTRLDFHCFRMDFSLTEQQIPMLMRLIMLIIALQKPELKGDSSANDEELEAEEDHDEQETDGEKEEQEESWAGWAWSWVPSILPAGDGDDELNTEQQIPLTGHIFHLGVYIDQASISFKVTESTVDRNYYGPRKVKFVPFLVAQMNGVFLDMISHQPDWLNVQTGISYISLEPYGDCFCGVREISPDLSHQEILYFATGSDQNNYILESLFDTNSLENKGARKSYNVCWEYHVLTVTETIMLEKSPALAVDLLHCLEIPEDFTAEQLSEIGNNLEYSNLKERSLVRVVVGPIEARVCSGLLHRISMIQCAAKAYDYDPYIAPKQEPSRDTLSPVSTDDFEALEANIPFETMQLTLFKLSVTLCQVDHPNFDQAIFHNHRKRRKSSRVLPLFPQKNLPQVSLSCQCLDAKWVRPMYPERLVSTVCQLPDAPNHMFDACHEKFSVKAVGVESQLHSGTHKQTVLLPSNFSFSFTSLLLPSLWANRDVLLIDTTLSAESIVVVFTKPQLMVFLNILQSLTESSKSSELLYGTSLLLNAFQDSESRGALDFLEVNVDGLSAQCVFTADTQAVSAQIGAVKVFILEPVNNDGSLQINTKQDQVLVLSGPDKDDTQMEVDISSRKNILQKSSPLLTCTIQVPLDPNQQKYPPVLFFFVNSISVNVDPIFRRWLTFMPETYNRYNPETNVSEAAVTVGTHTVPVQKRSRRLSEAGSSHRSPNPRESVHSSSDRDQIPNMHAEPVSPCTEAEDSINKESDETGKERNMKNSREQLLHWFPVWRGLVIFGDISHCVVYIPTQSLSTVDSTSIEETVYKSLKNNPNLDLMVIQFPHTTMRSANQRQGPNNNSSQLPVQLSDMVWSASKVSFPWSMALSDTCIYTVQKGRRLHFLKPTSTTATVGISTKPNQSDQSTLSSLGLCVHVDATPINLAVSEEQVILMLEITSCLSAMSATLSLVKSKTTNPPVIVPTEVPTPAQTPTSPTVFQESSASLDSPAVKQAGTEESSEKGVPVIHCTDDIKVTAWMQCTLARLSVTIYAFEKLKSSNATEFKLLMEMEDIMTSFDVQQVYLKMKLKVASANIHHFRRIHDATERRKSLPHWVPGPFLGLVMQPHEDSSGDDSPSPPPHGSVHHLHHRDAEDGGGAAASAANGSLFTATFTRARCINVHSRWGAAPTSGRNPKTAARGRGLRSGHLTASAPVVTQKPQRRQSSTTGASGTIASAASTGTMNARFISEIIVKMQAVDFVLSPFTLRAFMSVMQPLLMANSHKDDNLKQQSVPLSEDTLAQLNSGSLPLVYLETRAVRLIIPASELVDISCLHDVFVLQYDNVSLSPQVENPLSRVLVRPDIYHWAEQAGILRVPGSGVEDRQYQLDVSGLSLSTGRWHEFERVLARPNASSSSTVGFATGLRTMNENPALEWNQLQGSETIVPHVSLLPVIARADLCVVAAPAIILDTGILVCGHSLEINALKDIEMSASTRQLLLASALGFEVMNIIQPLQCAKPSRFVPQTTHEKVNLTHNTAAAMGVVTIDSGVDSNDVSSLPEDSVSGISLIGAGPTSTHPRRVSFNEQSLKLGNPIDEKCLKTIKNPQFCETKRQTATISSSGRSVEKISNTVPFEILLTSGSWSCLLYDIVDEHSQLPGSLLSNYFERETKIINSSISSRNSPEMDDCKNDSDMTSFDDDNSKVNEEKDTNNLLGNKTQPLLFVRLVQPHTFVSRQALNHKMQVSCFDVIVRTAKIDHHSSRDIPTVDDFNCVILETRGGDPHPGTGIPPSFLTIRWSRTMLKSPKLDISIGRPCKTVLSITRINSLLAIKNKLLESFEDITLLSSHHNQDTGERKGEMKGTPLHFVDFKNVFKAEEKKLTLNKVFDNTVVLNEKEITQDIKMGTENGLEEYPTTKVRMTDGPASIMNGFSSMTLSTSQIVVAVSTEGVEEEIAEILLSISGMNGSVSTVGAVNRGIPENITINSNIRCLMATTKFGGISRLLLNPWSFSLESCLSWETWHPNSPLMTLTIDSDCVLMDLGPDHLRCLMTLATEFSKLPNTTVTKNTEEEETQESVPSPLPWIQPKFGVEVEQQYQDDLRAGAFQFMEVQGNSGRREEIPLPYQVVFTASPPTMAWRYPQPRALTRVEIFPVPFRVAKSNGSMANGQTEQVLCELQCWSEVRSRWLRVVHFELSESETRRLQLRPSGSFAAGPAARIWRVRLAVHKDADDENGDGIGSSPTVIVCPQTLAACMRVDSFFSPILVPSLQVALDVAKIEMSLTNHTGILGSRPMPPPLSRFSADGLIPDTQTFAVASVGNVSLSFASWQNGRCSVDASGLIQLDIIDYAYLTQHCALEPFRVHLQAALAGGVSSAMELSCVSQPIALRFGPALAHTLAVSAQLWTQTLPILAAPIGFVPELTDPSCEPQIILTRYVICNDTNRAVRFGQASTDEDILLSSRQCHFYCWRSQKIKQRFRVGVDDGIWAWTPDFSINNEGVQILPLSSPDASDALSIVVRVTALSATQKQVTFSGQMAIRNNMCEAFECKILPNIDNSSRQPQYLIAGGNSFPPSLLISTAHDIVLRIRFQGLNSIWSGDIPLKISTTIGQPWLVKVPLMERGQFISVWCRVFHQTVPGGVRTLAMICPLYMIQSHLPMPANMNIETPGLKVTMQTSLSGRGVCQQLYCPGTIDHSHKLMLQVKDSLPSDPYVPLSYSMIDERAFFKPNLGENLDVDKMAEYPFGPKEQEWPFVSAGLLPSEWKACEEEPETFVQVAYRPLGPYCATLLVELRPWVLLVNTLGVQISVRSEDEIVCSVVSHGVSMPPRLESTFHLIVESSDSDRYFISAALQLARPDWTRSTFYMPRIAGLIPREGNMIVTASGRDSLLCVFSIQSKVIDEMRIVHFRPAFTFVNASCSSEVKVGLLAVSSSNKSVSLENKLENIQSIKLPPTETTFLLEHKEGRAMLYWTLIGKKSSNNEEIGSYDEKDLVFYVTLSLGFGWSCPIRLAGDSPHRVQFSVPANKHDGKDILITESFVLTYEEKDGQVLLGLYPEPHPHIVVHNKCNFKLACAQSSPENNGKAASEVEHLKWWCVVPPRSKSHYHLPEVAKSSLSDRSRNISPLLVFGLESATGGDRALWSYGIDVNESQERFLYLPGHGDVRVSVIVHCYTSHVSVETVSHVEISARDIRARLLEHGTEVDSAKTEFNCGGKGNLTDVVVDSEQKKCSQEICSSRSNVSVKSGASSSYCTAVDMVADDSEKPKQVIAGNERQVPELDILITQSPIYRVTTDIYGPKRSITNCFIKGVFITLLEDIPKENSERTEVIMFCLDNLCITSEPEESLDDHKSLKIKVLIGDLQIDNQMFQRGGFDFPVVLMGQPTAGRRPRPRDCYFSLSTSAQRLIEQTTSHALVQINIIMVQPCHLSTITATDVKIAIGPLSAYVEDTLIMSLMDTLGSFAPGTLVMLCEGTQSCHNTTVLRQALAVRVLRESLFQSEETAKPLRIRSLTIEPLSILLSVHTSVKLYIALDHTPLQFNAFERKCLVTTPYRLGHSLTMHYLSGAFYGLGWVVGSLELLGSPSGFARTLGVGLHDFIILPYQGIFLGPWAFLVGISHGSASLMKHITAGTLTSVTKMASSVARNLDRLTLDQEHMAQAEELRRHRPQGLTQGLMQGLQGLGISILGAVGGIAHHPIQSVMTDGASTKALVAGVGLGLVGVVTKPLSGAAEFVALTGEGLLNGAGWTSMPEIRHNPIIDHTFCGSNSRLKYAWKLVGEKATEKDSLLFVTEATAVSPNGVYEAVALVLCTHALFLVNLEEDSTHRVHSLVEVSSFDHPSDPTLVCFQFRSEYNAGTESSSHDRVVDFVRQSAGLVHGTGYDPTDPDVSSGSYHNGESSSPESPLTFFVNPQSRTYFLSLLSLVKRQCEGKGFPIL